MSSASKQSTLRIVVPKDLAPRTISTLSSLGKTEVEDLALSTGRLTTENIVRSIKDCTKLREEMTQALRQLGIPRNPGYARALLLDLAADSSKAETQTAGARSEFQKVTSELGGIERQTQEVEKQITTVEQLKATGFSNEEMLSAATGFRRILGRLPSKKLDAAQRALRALLKERTVMTTGARRNDSVYLLVATPTENASQTLQTLLLYDFIPTDMPTFDGPDLGEALKSWQSKKDELAQQKKTLDARLDGLRKSMAHPLNESVDHIEETLLLPRGSLRLGEGTTATHIFTRLAKPPTAIQLNSLQNDGVVELD
ncbi:MAG TPA: hypothetical protein VNA15_07050 [Candidatus Angelobacter sp.]|nr:hypothetical protein [Candidatus Angelobacter sp.]